MVHSNTTNAKSRVRQSQVCYLRTTHSSALNVRRFMFSKWGTFKGRVMGPMLVLVSPCFSENVIVTCKMTHFSHFSVTREATQKFLQHISHLIHAYTYFAPYWLCLPNFCKNCEFIMHGFSLVRLLVLILIRAILEQSMNNKMVSKI